MTIFQAERLQTRGALFGGRVEITHRVTDSVLPQAYVMETLLWKLGINLIFDPPFRTGCLSPVMQITFSLLQAKYLGRGRLGSYRRRLLQWSETWV